MAERRPGRHFLKKKKSKKKPQLNFISDAGFRKISDREHGKTAIMVANMISGLK